MQNLTEKRDYADIYADKSKALRTENDVKFGIVSQEINGQWVRNAIGACSFEDSERPAHHAPEIEANNVLMRCLSRLGPIDYAIKHLKQDEIRKTLYEGFQTLEKDITCILNDEADNNKQKSMEQQEKAFNTFLIQQLHEAGLTRGCHTAEEAEKLLFHYRNYASLLKPTLAMVTITYDKKYQVFQRETQYPVTKKTSIQINKQCELNEVNANINNEISERLEIETPNMLAIHQADAIFADLLLKDDRELPAQARKTHPVGVKNGFITKVELIQLKKNQNIKEIDISNLKATPENTLWLGRMGSPAYIGKGEKSESIFEQTVENLKQIRETAKTLMEKDSLKLHITTLNTYSLNAEKQQIIIQNTIDAAAKLQDQISIAPTNFLGTFENIETEFREINKAITFGDKVSRLGEATQITLLAASNEVPTLSVVHCASGQDRTGTLIEKVIDLWTASRIEESNLAKVEDQQALLKQVELTRAQAFNAAEITTHLIAGSPGMKMESMAGNTFDEQSNQEFYLASAQTNKKNKVNTVDFLAHASQKQENTFKEKLDALKNATNMQQGMDITISASVQLLIEQICNVHNNYDSFEDLERLIELLDAVHDDKNTTLSMDQIDFNKLIELANEFERIETPPYKQLHACLSIFIGVIASTIITPLVIPFLVVGKLFGIQSADSLITPLKRSIQLIKDGIDTLQRVPKYQAIIENIKTMKHDDATTITSELDEGAIGNTPKI